jgi:putative transposase
MTKFKTDCGDAAQSMIVTYKWKHHKNFAYELQKARLVAEYAVINKNNRSLLSSKYVKHIGLKSAISNQVLKKYGQPNIKKVSKVSLIVPNQAIRYNSEKSLVEIIPLKWTFKWNAGRPIIKINQIEIGSEMVYLNVNVQKQTPVDTCNDAVLGVDLNCGGGRHIAVAACTQTGEVLCLGKCGPNIRKKYRKLRRMAQEKRDYKSLHEISDREQRITRDLDHKISRKLVDYAQKYKCRIVMEQLTGITKRGNSKNKRLNEIVHSWSFYRLQTFVEYKCQAAGIPFVKVPAHYTSQQCSYCGKLGERSGPSFVCKSPLCEVKGNRRHADVNAAWNIGLRYVNQH